MFGIAASVNVMAWRWTMMLVMPLVGMVAGALKFYAYELFYADVKDATADASTSSIMMGVLKKECMMEAIMELSAFATLAMNLEEWKWAQYLSADEETQAEWRAEKMASVKAEKMMWENEMAKDGTNTILTMVDFTPQQIQDLEAMAVDGFNYVELNATAAQKAAYVAHVTAMKDNSEAVELETMAMMSAGFAASDTD